MKNQFKNDTERIQECKLFYTNKNNHKTMFKELLIDKIETIANLDNGISEILKSNAVSEITEHNKPFDCDILLDEIGLVELKVDSPIFKYKGNRHQCELHKLNLRRTFELNKDFNLLNQDEKNSILNELIPILKDRFTHIYKIIEKRNSFIVAGYVENHIDYICYGNKIVY
jgi:hypothetical protein